MYFYFKKDCCIYCSPIIQVWNSPSINMVSVIFTSKLFLIHSINFHPPHFQEIEKFRSLASEIMGLPSIEHFDMIRLDCEDLKRGLASACRKLADQLLSRVSTDHRRENER